MKTLKKNEEIKGKIVTFSSFREMLLGELNKNFPEEYEDYVKIRQPEITSNEEVMPSVPVEAQPTTELAPVKKEEM